MDEAAPQAAGSIAGMIDWETLSRLTAPVTLELVGKSFPGWRTGRSGKWLWAVRTCPPGEKPGPNALTRLVVVARTTIGLAEQVDAQERLMAMTDAAYIRLVDAIGRTAAA